MYFGIAFKYLLSDELRYCHLLLQCAETYLCSHFHYFVAHHHLLVYFILVCDVYLLELDGRYTFAAVPLEIFSFQFAVHLLEHWSSRASLPVHCLELIYEEFDDLFQIFLILDDQINVLLRKTKREAIPTVEWQLLQILWLH